MGIKFWSSNDFDIFKDEPIKILPLEDGKNQKQESNDDGLDDGKYVGFNESTINRLSSILFKTVGHKYFANGNDKLRTDLPIKDLKCILFWANIGLLLPSCTATSIAIFAHFFMCKRLLAAALKLLVLQLDETTLLASSFMCKRLKLNSNETPF